MLMSAASSLQHKHSVGITTTKNVCSASASADVLLFSFAYAWAHAYTYAPVKPKFDKSLIYRFSTFSRKTNKSRMHYSEICIKRTPLRPSQSLVPAYNRFSGPVHASSEEFENGGFTLKTHQMFSVNTRKRKKCFPSTI